MEHQLESILFDLDGTLLDTAPDLALALNALLSDEDKPKLSVSQIRPYVSQGARGLIELGFGKRIDEPYSNSLIQRLVDNYSANIAQETQPFPDVMEVIENVENRGLQWGIVTNKKTSLTERLLDQLGLFGNASCVICGDTTAKSKPHPEPLFEACKRVNSTPAECVYIGDAAKDIEAGRRAGMRTLIALYGYIGEDDHPEQWEATAKISSPGDLLLWLDSLS
ncbi:MAG: HAD-IA family hydrolase [Methylococcales bacterium]